MHGAAFYNLRYYRKNRMGLGFIFFVHYRRIIYSVIIVFMINNPSNQIQLIQFISLIMMIMVMNSKPFSTNMESISECLNEIVVILVSYCLIIFSDFVPSYNLQVKDSVGFILVIMITVVTCVYVYIIISSVLIKLVDIIKNKYEIR